MPRRDRDRQRRTSDTRGRQCQTITGVVAEPLEGRLMLTVLAECTADVPQPAPALGQIKNCDITLKRG
jgi:hypothetical protein